MRRLDAIVLGAFGVLVVHQFAYTVAAIGGSTNSIAHGHLGLAWFAATLGALAMLGRAVVTSLRRRSHDPGSRRSLTAWILAGYVALEQVERGLDGIGATALFSEPVFWLGLAATPVVALVIHRSLTSVHDALDAYFARGRSPKQWARPRPELPLIDAPLVLLPARIVRNTPRRGPPGR